MEDIRDVIVDWTVSPQAPPSVGGGGPKQKLNNAVQNNNGPANNYFMNNNSNKMPETYGYNNKNTRFIANANYIINGQLANIKNKNNMRRSMDNLLEIETNNYPQNFQVVMRLFFASEREKSFLLLGGQVLMIWGWEIEKKKHRYLIHDELKCDGY